MNNSIAAIANRIQERANQLSQERSSLQILQNKLNNAQEQLNDEQIIHETKREKLLLQTRSSHKYELEVIKYKKLIDNLKLQIQSESIEKKEIEIQIQSIRNDYDSKNSNIYVPHQFQTSIYQRRLEHNVQRLKAKRRRREETLDRLALETERNREEVHSMEREGRRLKDEIKMMEDVEVREDEEIAAVAMQIRATLAKVCTVVLFCPVLSCSRVLLDYINVLLHSIYDSLIAFSNKLILIHSTEIACMCVCVCVFGMSIFDVCFDCISHESILVYLCIYYVYMY